MKSAQCDQCDQVFHAETFQGWFKQMHAHYTGDHADILKEMMATGTKEDGERWMAEARARFEASDNTESHE